MDPPPRRPIELGDQRRSRGFPVAAGDRNDLAGTEPEKAFHLTGDDHPGASCGGELVVVIVHARRAKDDVEIGEMIEIIVAQTQCDPDLFECGSFVLAKFGAIGPVEYGDRHAISGEQADERKMADASADQSDAFGFQ